MAHPDVGRSVAELDTPALIVDLDALEANIATMAGVCREAGVDWRPHVKASKAPDLARKLVAGGAAAITCAKVSEAEVMADGGLDDVLIANEIVGPTKVARLVQLAGRARVCVAADSEANLREISHASESAGVEVEVLVDVDVGLHRAGVRPAEAPALAQLACELPGLGFRGLMGYEGHVMGISDPEEKERACEAAADLLEEARELVEAAGFAVGVTSGGGTGNYRIAVGLGRITELQAGGGVLMDRAYREQMGVKDHAQALFVQTQVVSAAAPGRAVGDVGWKATGMHTGLPLVNDREGVGVRSLNAEHCNFTLDDGVTLTPGERLLLVPHYSDSTVLLHRQMHAVRGGVVEEVWPVAGAGMLQ